MAKGGNNMKNLLTDKSINWDGISAISNIIVVFFTFITILITIWLTFRNTTPKGRVMTVPADKNINFHFINNGVVNITLMAGIISTNKVIKKGHPKREIIKTIVIQKTISPTENYHWKLDNKELSKRLLEIKDNLNVGDEINLVIHFLDSFRKKRRESFKFKIVNPNSASVASSNIAN
jgi:hypothetical protein